MTILTLVLSLVLTALSHQAYAVQKEGGRCVLSADVLANPDLVIQDAMENSSGSLSTNCNDVGHSDRATYFAERKLIKSYPIEGSKIPNAGWGIYRDFKIHAFEAGPDLEGSKTRIYDVELIYIAMTTIDSTVPICERSRVPMRVVHTPWGWRFMRQHIFGANLRAEIREAESKVMQAKNPAYRYSVGQIRYLEKWSKDEIDRLNDFANRCQLTLQ
jgi:hypothetical protein